MISYFYKTAKQEVFSSLKEVKHGCWIHVDEAVLSDLHYICQMTGLDLVDIQDALDRYELPRIEKIGQNILMHIRHPVEREGHLHTMTLTMILTSHYLITISPIHMNIIHAIANKKNTLSSLQKTELLSHLVVRIIQEFSLQIRKTRHNVMTQEKDMSHVESEDISALTKYEEILNQYFSSLGAIRSVLEITVQGKLAFFFEKEHQLFDDVLNTVKQAEDLCDIMIKNIRSLRDSYQIIFANSLTKTIKLLTAITILFNIPTMIASIYGMNVDLPFAKDHHAFMLLMGIIAFFSAFCGYFFHKRKWL